MNEGTTDSDLLPTIEQKRGREASDASRQGEGAKESHASSSRQRQRGTSSLGDQEAREEASDKRRSRSSSSGSQGSEGSMSDWRSAVRKPISYTITNDVVRLQTAFVTVVAVLGTLVLVMLYLLLPSKVSLPYPSPHEDHLHSQPQSCNCIPRSTYNAVYPLTRPEIRSSGVRYRIALIADLDLDSKSQPASPANPAPSSASSSATASSSISSWHSFLLKGFLTHLSEEEAVRVDWDVEGRRRLTSPLSSGGRGMELSELTVFNGKLYSCDDRTGIVYQIPWQDAGEEAESSGGSSSA